MTDLDKALRQTLSEEDAALLQRFGAEPSLPEQFLDTFRGPLGGFNVIVLLALIAATAGGVFCGWRFATAADVPAMLIWGALAGLAVAAVALLKIWFWMELHRQSIMREIKRLELQVARLVAARAGV